VRAAQPDLKLKPLTPRQANALQMTLDGYRKNEICDKLGITQKTLWTWRRLPAWNEQLNVAVRDSSGDGEVHIRTLLPLATAALKKLILTGTDNVMLGAARTVLEAHANLVAREQDQAVMAELEARLGELQAVARNQGFMAQPMGPTAAWPATTAPAPTTPWTPKSWPMRTILRTVTLSREAMPSDCSGSTPVYRLLS
jgi:hypothetical protein